MHASSLTVEPNANANTGKRGTRGELTKTRLNAIMQAEGYKFRKQRPWHKTPPYVTARPEVTHRKLRSETGEKLRFVVMATDGRKLRPYPLIRED